MGVSCGLKITAYNYTGACNSTAATFGGICPVSWKLHLRRRVDCTYSKARVQLGVALAVITTNRQPPLQVNMSSVPRPGGVPIHIPKCSTRNVRDIPSVPPEFDGRPDLPSPRSPYFVPGYNVTTHIVPASYPRQSFHDSRQYPHLTPDTTIPPPPERKAERQAWAMGTSSKLVQKPMAILKGRLENHHAEAPAGREESPVMWNVVNRYARVGPHKGEKDIGITVVVNHAIGFHKEVSLKRFFAILRR